MQPVFVQEKDVTSEELAVAIARSKIRNGIRGRVLIEPRALVDMADRLKTLTDFVDSLQTIAMDDSPEANERWAEAKAILANTIRVRDAMQKDKS